MTRAAALALAVLLAGAVAVPASAVELAMPSNARLTVERETGPDRYRVPVSVFAQGQVGMIDLDGDIRRAAWRLDSPGLTPLQVLQPLKAQLVTAGYEIALDCADSACGGFDFRFAIETLPGPNMYVNIRAFHFVTALRMNDAGTPQEAVTVLTSTTATSAYVQIVQAGSAPVDAAPPDPEQPAAPILSGSGDLTKALLAEGHVVLRDLDFDTGTSDLGKGPFASLVALSEFLKSEPGVRVALVGHTDSVGGLQPNITLSRKRAQSVRQRLVGVYGVSGSQLEGEGMGYLAPVASNLTEAGREANRRVEVVMLSAE